MYSDGDTPKGWVAPFGHPGIKACSQLPRAFRSVPRPSSPLGAKASTRCPSHARKHTGLCPKKDTSPTHHAQEPSTPQTHPTGHAKRDANPIPRRAKHTQSLSTHKTPLNPAAAPALSRANPTTGSAQPGSDTHAGTATDTTARPRKHVTTTRQPKPPEMPCAPRSAPEPDSQSTKNNTHTGRAASPASCRDKDGKARSLAATQPNHAKHGRGAAAFSVTTAGNNSLPEITAWWRRTGSNRRPPACKAGALPAELRPQDPAPRPSPGTQAKTQARTKHQAKMVGQGGLEPPTPRLSSVCSNQLSY